MKYAILAAAVAAWIVQFWLSHAAGGYPVHLAVLWADVITRLFIMLALAQLVGIVGLAIFARGSGLLGLFGGTAVATGVLAVIWNAVSLAPLRPWEVSLGIVAPGYIEALQPLALGLTGAAVAAWARRSSARRAA